jgi:serine/threonine-protein kinase PknK
MDTHDRRDRSTTGGVGSDAAAVLGIAGYDELVEVGRGGFGVVYRAVQPDLARVVAIKVLTSSSLDERARHRFDRERRVLGMLGAHPHIISVFQSGYSDERRPYIVMEYMPGGSLADRLETLGALSWPAVLDIGVKVAGALHNAHLAGVLHRDLKPDNILMSAFGEPVLADFGIAAVTGANTSRTGNLMASVAYAAPEVLEGKRTTPAADIYSFGATLFSLLAAHAPFWRATDDSVIPVVTRILTERPPDLRTRGVPPAVCDVVERSLAKEPDDRFASAEELGRALQAVQRAHDLMPTALVFSLTALDQAAGSGLAGRTSDTPTPSGTPAGLPWLDRVREAAGSPPATTPPRTSATPIPAIPTPATPTPATPTPATPTPATPTPATPTPASAPGGDGGRRRSVSVVAAAAAAAVGLAALIWSVAGGGDGDGDDGSRPTTAISATDVTGAPTSAATTPSPTASTSPPSSATTPVTPVTAATVAVPDVSGQFASPDSVTQALTTAGFVPTRVPTASPTTPAGTVIGLDPAIGARLAPGSTVKVLVSTGSPDAAVPPVDGLSADAAQQALEAAGFQVRREVVDNPFLEAGVVIETAPPVGTIELKGVTIVLRIAAGPTPATTAPVTPTSPVTSPGTTPTTPTTPPPPPPSGPRIPNVVGLSPQAAQSRLQSEGFGAVRSADQCSTTQDGLVISQAPGAGPAEAGATVFFVVGSALMC